MTITRTAAGPGAVRPSQFDGTMTCVATAPETTSTSMKVQTEQGPGALSR